MANIVQIKRSSVPGKKPQDSDLEVGELAVNLNDGILYSKNTTGNVIVVGSSTTSNVIEGANLYFTNVRAVSAFTAGSGISLASNGRITSTVSGNSSNIYFQNTAPTSPQDGEIWIDSDTGNYYTYFNDGTSSQWAEMVASNNISVGADNTDLISEGTVNLYYSNARVSANVATLGYASNTYVNTRLLTKANVSDLNTSNVTEGSSLYFTNSRVVSGITTGTVSNITISGNAVFNGNSFSNGIITASLTGSPSQTAVLNLRASNTFGGTGYSDLIKLVNTSGGATNPNKFIRLNSSGDIEIIDSTYSNNIFYITNSGNLYAKGKITRGVYTPGEVIKDTMLSNSEITVVSTTIATSGSNTNFITYDYTPVSSYSYLIVHYHLGKYEPAGTTDDSWYSVLLVDGSEIAYGWQKVNDDGQGTSGRSGVLFPLTGRYTNSSTSSKQIQVAARRDSADDSISIVNSSTSMWLRITEVAR